MTETTKNDGVAVNDLKLTVYKDPVSGKAEKTGKAWLKLPLVNNDGEEAVWFSGVAFGGVALALGKHLKKGSRIKVTSGKVSQKEYKKKDDSVGVENNLIVNAAIVVTDDGPKEIDEFTA